MKTSYLNQINKREEKEKDINSPQKILEYKFKIEHL
jgi:hypothetical protein